MKHTRDRVSSEGNYVCKCKPHTMVTFQVSQFMSQNSLVKGKSQRVSKLLDQGMKNTFGSEVQSRNYTGTVCYISRDTRQFH